MKKFLVKNKKIIVFIFLVVILLTTFFLRYFLQIYQGRVHFANDEARDVLIIKDHFQNRDLILVGPLQALSVKIGQNLYIGPFYYNLIAPALWLGNFSPYAPIWLMIFLSLLSVFLIFYLGRKLISLKAGIIAAILFATSEVLVFYSWAWNPNPMPLFVLLYTIFLYLFLQRKNYGFWILIWLTLGLLTQLDLVGVIFIPITILLLSKFRPKVVTFRQAWKYILVAIATFLISYAPYIYFELTNNFLNSHGFIKLFSSGTDQSISFVQNLHDKLVYIFKFFNQLFFGGAREFYLLTLILGIALFIYNLKNHKKFLPFLSLISVSILIVCYCLFNFGMNDHYLIMLVPLVFLSLADFGNYLFSLGKSSKILAIVLLILIIGLNLVSYRNNYRAFYSIDNDKTTAATTYNTLIQVNDYMIKDANGEKFNLVLNQASDGNYRYVFDYLLDQKNLQVDSSARTTYQIVDPSDFTDYNAPSQILTEQTIGKVKIIKYKTE